MNYRSPVPLSRIEGIRADIRMTKVSSDTVRSPSFVGKAERLLGRRQTPKQCGPALVARH
jgi:hypothetical protein